jgi:hypothetical protein
MELGSKYECMILILEETLGFNHTRPWSQGHYFPCANWSLAKKKKKLPLLKILAGEGSGSHNYKTKQNKNSLPSFIEIDCRFFL